MIVLAIETLPPHQVDEAGGEAVLVLRVDRLMEGVAKVLRGHQCLEFIKFG